MIKSFSHDIIIFGFCKTYNILSKGINHMYAFVFTIYISEAQVMIFTLEYVIIWEYCESDGIWKLSFP